MLGAIAAPRFGGLGLDLRTTAMIVEELARGSAALAAIVVAHLTAADAIARRGSAEQARAAPAADDPGREPGHGGPRRRDSPPRAPATTGFSMATRRPSTTPLTPP